MKCGGDIYTEMSTQGEQNGQWSRVGITMVGMRGVSGGLSELRERGASEIGKCWVRGWPAKVLGPVTCVGK